MSTPSMSRFAALMLSIPLLITAGSSLAQTEVEALPSNENRPNNEDIERERPPFRETEEGNEIESDEITLLKQRIQKLEEAQSTASSGMLGIPYPLLVAGGSGLIGLIALALSITAMIRTEKQRAAVEELNRRNQTLVSRIGDIEVQIDWEHILNKYQAAQAERTTSLPPQTAEPKPTQAVSIISKEAQIESDQINNKKKLARRTNTDGNPQQFTEGIKNAKPNAKQAVDHTSQDSIESLQKEAEESANKATMNEDHASFYSHQKR